jgi:hypothetical protein
VDPRHQAARLRTRHWTRPPAGAVDLVITTPTGVATAANLGEGFAAARLALRPGGLLVTVTMPARASDGGPATRLGDLVTTARAAGFSYIQHNVALRARMVGDQLQPYHREQHDDSLGRRVRHRVVHADVLVFSNPAAGDA